MEQNRASLDPKCVIDHSFTLGRHFQWSHVWTLGERRKNEIRTVSQQCRSAPQWGS